MVLVGYIVTRLKYMNVHVGCVFVDLFYKNSGSFTRKFYVNLYVERVNIFFSFN
jgi:hypothetical protein